MLKELRMQKNNILDRMSSINEKCVSEKRKRNFNEQMEFDKLERELSEVEFAIENEQKKIRSGCVCTTTSETRKDGKKMTDFQKAINKEGRVDLTETRANTATKVTEGGHQQVQTPGRFVDQVYMDAVHGNLLLSLCTVFQTEENNRILVGERLGKMQQLGELDEIDDRNFVTNEHALVPVRYGVANTISRHLINTQGFDVQEHVQRLFAQALAETMEQLIANALDAVDEGLTMVDFDGKECSLLQEIVKTLAVQPESLRHNSTIIMHPEMYAEMIVEEDAVGRNILDYSFDQTLRAKICGVPVIVSAEVERNNVYVGSLKDAVICGVNIQNFESEQKPRANAVSFFMNVYAGAVVKQPAALTRIAFHQE